MTDTKISSNGGSRYQSDKVRVAIIGVGNCASSLVQGVEFYKDADANDSVPGLMHVDLGGYHICDIEFSAAFDIDADKVGKDLSEAIWSGQNNTIKFADVPNLDVPVQRGMTHDGLGKYLKEKITKAPGETADIVKILKETRTDVVVSYLPVGSEQATKWYVEQILEAGCGFVNCIPVFIARENYWAKRFEEHGLPIVGDDIKSQVGATIVHRMLARLFHERGVEMKRTSQLNVGGNMDFYNMLERERLESKKISKTQAVTSIMGHELPAERRLHRPLGLRAVAHRPQVGAHPARGRGLRRRAADVEAKLEVWDSPNSAGIVIDAVRCCKLALNHGLGGPIDGRLGVPHEVAARAAPGPGRAPDGRGLHRRVRRCAEAAGAEARAAGRALEHGRGRDDYRHARTKPARPRPFGHARGISSSGGLCAGNPVALGAPPRGQPLRRAAVG